MSVAIVGKLLGGFIVSSGGVAAIAYMVMSSTPYISLSKTESENIYIYAISKEITVPSADNQPIEEIKTGTNEKNYQCKFDNKDYGCEISVSEAFDTQTKQWNIDKFKTAVVTGATTITKNELKTKDKIYRIKINFQIGDWTKIQKTEKFSIDIIPNTEKDKSKKYASLKPLFAINSDGVTINKYTKTQHFVVKNKTTSTTSSADTKTADYTCLTSKTETANTNTTEAAPCNVYDFSSDSDANSKTLDTINFKNTETESAIITPTTESKYYLVKLKTPVKTNEVKHIKIAPSASPDASWESEEVIPAIYVAEKIDSIFILQKTPTKAAATKAQS